MNHKKLASTCIQSSFLNETHSGKKLILVSYEQPLTVKPPLSTLHLNGFPRLIGGKHFYPTFCLSNKCLIVRLAGALVLTKEKRLMKLKPS